eukprot:1147546-Pelagomonas_calceolata.AAC.6
MVLAIPDPALAPIKSLMRLKEARKQGRSVRPSVHHQRHQLPCPPGGRVPGPHQVLLAAAVCTVQCAPCSMCALLGAETVLLLTRRAPCSVCASLDAEMVLRLTRCVPHQVFTLLGAAQGAALERMSPRMSGSHLLDERLLLHPRQLATKHCLLPFLDVLAYILGTVPSALYVTSG